MHDILLPPNRVTRLRNSHRFPDQAALAARLPLLGRRVPAREYWRGRPLHVPGRDMAASALNPIAGRFRHRRGSGIRRVIRRVAAAAARRVNSIGRRLSHRTPRIGGLHISAPSLNSPREVRRSSAARAPRALRDRARGPLHRRWPALLAGVSAGLLVMFYFDPASGRRRRALARDKLVHARHIFTRDVPRRIERRVRFFGGVARGIRHETAGRVLHDGHHVNVDDETLVARVRSEALRTANVKSGEINVEAYEGCVTLRGQMEHPDHIRRLIEATRGVEGVREVRSYLHLPGTLPANKAEIYEREVAPQI